MLANRRWQACLIAPDRTAILGDALLAVTVTGLAALFFKKAGQWPPKIQIGLMPILLPRGRKTDRRHFHICLLAYIMTCN